MFNIKQQRTPNLKFKSGCPALLSKWDKRRIYTYIRQSHTTLQETPETIIKALNLTIDHTILISALHELGYYCYVTCHRCLLKDINYKCRLAFVRKYCHFTVNNWKQGCNQTEPKQPNRLLSRTELSPSGQNGPPSKPNRACKPPSRARAEGLLGLLGLITGLNSSDSVTSVTP